MAVILRALALLSVSGASFALFAQELQDSWLAPFIAANTLSLADRQRLIIGMAIGVAVAVVAGLLALWNSVRRLNRIAHLLAPAILIGFIPPLSHPGRLADALNLCVVLGALVLLGERLFRMALAAAAERPTRVDVRELPRPLGAPGSRSHPPLAPGPDRAGGRHRLWRLHVRVHAAHARALPDLQLRSRPVRQHLLEHPARTPAARRAARPERELARAAQPRRRCRCFFLLPFYAIKPGGADSAGDSVVDDRPGRDPAVPLRGAAAPPWLRGT